MNGIVIFCLTVVIAGLNLFALWVIAKSIQGARRQIKTVGNGLYSATFTVSEFELHPLEPNGEATIWYRGWECGWEEMRDHYSGEGYTAYLGGADLDAISLQASTWTELLNAVDEWEEDNG